VSAFLPDDYLPSEAERIAFYKRLLDAPPAGLPSLREELEDRCGRLPPPAETLFRVAALRHRARRHGAVHVGLHGDALEVRLAPKSKVPQDVVPRLLQAFGPRLSFLPGPPDGLRLEGPFPEGPLAAAESVLSLMGE
jgi:transcription-repair coupling factor (superfamily II helicase)